MLIFPSHSSNLIELIRVSTCVFLVQSAQFNFVHQRQVQFCLELPVQKKEIITHLQLLAYTSEGRETDVTYVLNKSDHYIQHHLN